MSTLTKGDAGVRPAVRIWFGRSCGWVQRVDHVELPGDYAAAVWFPLSVDYDHWWLRELPLTLTGQAQKLR